MQLQLITPTKSPSFCMTIHHQTHKHYGPASSVTLQPLRNQPTLAPPPLLLQKHTDPPGHDFAHSPDSRHQPRLANVTCALSWRLYGFNPAILLPHRQETAGIARHYYSGGVCVGAIQYTPNDVSTCIAAAKEERHIHT
jgi:hypothetical protein